MVYAGAYVPLHFPHMSEWDILYFIHINSLISMYMYERVCFHHSQSQELRPVGLHGRVALPPFQSYKPEIIPEYFGLSFFDLTLLWPSALCPWHLAGSWRST